MKICLLAPANNPHTKKIAHSLCNKGYEIYIYTFHPASLHGVQTVYFPPLVKPLGKINYILQSQKIKRYLDRLKPDILHAHYVSSYGVVGYLTRYRPLVISVWGKDIYDAPENPVLGYLIKRSLAKADYVLSTSKTMAKRTREFVKKEIAITPFGIDLTKFYPQERSLRKVFVIGTARGLAPKYGIDYLVKAFAIVVREIPCAQLYIAGTGPQRSKLTNMASELGVAANVKFFGFINPDRMPEFISGLDVFVMPSISESESFGVAALEAQACGIPVIASEIGGLRETVVDSSTGYLVPPKDINAIAEKILIFFKKRDLLVNMGQAGVRFVKENYDWQENIKIIEKVYENIHVKSR